MREMKDSGISWINEIPRNWNVEPIKYSYRLIAGATPESTNVDFWDGDIKWITPADFKTKDVFVMGGSRNLTIEGYNKNQRGEQTLKLSYKEAFTQLTVTVLKKDAGTITVSLTLLGLSLIHI